VYDPQGVVNLTKTGNTKQATRNAESWTLAGLSIYLQQTFDLPNPPVPGVPVLEDDDDLEGHYIDPPAGFVSPFYSNGTIFNGANDPIQDPSQYVRTHGIFELLNPQQQFSENSVKFWLRSVRLDGGESLLDLANQKLG